MKLTVAITGTTGVIYGIKLLEALKQTNVETHLIISDWAAKCIEMETKSSLDYVRSLATESSNEKNMAASVSSGTHKVNGMIIAPCSMKTLSSIANGYDDNLIARAASVTIKESRKLVLMVRETPFSPIHLENMLKLARIGVVILPPVVEFYTAPTSVEDIINHGVGKCLDQFDIEHNLYKRWGS